MINTLMKAASAGGRKALFKGALSESLELKFFLREEKYAIETHIHKCINVGMIY